MVHVTSTGAVLVLVAAITRLSVSSVKAQVQPANFVGFVLIMAFELRAVRVSARRVDANPCASLLAITCPTTACRSKADTAQLL